MNDILQFARLTDSDSASSRAHPRPDQEQAVSAVLEHFRTGADRVQLIAAAGTGKTLMALWVAEAVAGRCILVFVPSLALIKQTLDVWHDHADPHMPIQAMAICSDETVADDIPRVELAKELAVTTDVEEAAGFLRAAILGRGRRVVFATYQSVRVVEEALAESRLLPDLMVCDEAHRIAGAEGKLFQAVLDSVRVPSRRRLFMTATPRILSSQSRDIAAEPVVSMDDVERFGPVAYRLSFGDAIQLGLLADYRIDVLVARDTTVRDLLTEEPNGLASLAQAAATVNALDAGVFRHAFSFHRTHAAANRFLDSFRHIAEAADGAGGHDRTQWVAATVFGTHAVAERRATLNAFFAAPGGVVASVRALAEGVDVPPLDAILFVDPKRSVVDIAQIVGRALRRDPKRVEKVAHIVVPVVLGGGPSPEEAIAASAWEPVWRVIAAMAANDERLARELAVAARAKARHDGATESTSHVATHDVLGDGHFLERSLYLSLPRDMPLEQFRRAIAIRALDELADAWEYGFGRLQAYSARAGIADVPSGHREADGFRLGAWPAGQRNAYRGGRLSTDRVCSLESLSGWWWGRRDDAWSRGMAALGRHVARNGRVIVGAYVWSRYSGWLGLWVMDRHAEYWRGSLPPARAHALAALPGWTWGQKPTVVPVSPARIPLNEAPHDAALLAAVARLSARLQKVPPALDAPLLAPAGDQAAGGRRGPRSVPAIFDWLVREYAPAALALSGCRADARQLAGLEPIRDSWHLSSARGRIRTILDDLNNVAQRVSLAEHRVTLFSSLTRHAPRGQVLEAARSAVASRTWHAGLAEYSVERELLYDIATIAALSLIIAAIRDVARTGVIDSRVVALQRIVGRLRRTRRGRVLKRDYELNEFIVERYFRDDAERLERTGLAKVSDARSLVMELISAQCDAATDRLPYKLLQRFGRMPRHARWFRPELPTPWDRRKPRSGLGPRNTMRVLLTKWRHEQQKLLAGRISGLATPKWWYFRWSGDAEPGDYIVAEEMRDGEPPDDMRESSAPQGGEMEFSLTVASRHAASRNGNRGQSVRRKVMVLRLPRRPEIYLACAERLWRASRASETAPVSRRGKRVVRAVPSFGGLTGVQLIAATAEHACADSNAIKWYRCVWLRTLESGELVLESGCAGMRHGQIVIAAADNDLSGTAHDRRRTLTNPKVAMFETTVPWTSPSSVPWRGVAPEHADLIPTPSGDIAEQDIVRPAVPVGRASGSPHRSLMPNGIVVNNRDERFEVNLAVARQYAAEHGHLLPTKNERPDGISLYMWLKNQELRIARGTLEPDRQAKVGALPGWLKRMKGGD